MLLDEVRLALRVTGTELDAEIQGLIDAAVADLTLSGVAAEKAQSATDPLIKRAVVTYCRAQFDYDDNSADRLLTSYQMLKSHLTLAGDYNSLTVTLTVTSSGVPVVGAKVLAGGSEKLTNSKGVVIFPVMTPNVDLDYTVTKVGYQEVAGSVYVDGSKSVEVNLNAA